MAEQKNEGFEERTFERYFSEPMLIPTVTATFLSSNLPPAAPSCFSAS